MAEAEASATFIENHGLVVVAEDLETALEHTTHVESLSRLYLQASAVGEPVELDAEALEATIEKFADYGHPVPLVVTVPLGV